MFSLDNLFAAFESGKVLFDKNTYTISVSGSAQAIVPVKPVCPKLFDETQQINYLKKTLEKIFKKLFMMR